MFDTHTHLQFEVFENNIDEVVDLARNAGVSKIMVVGTDLESSKNAVNLASQFNGIFASVGIHPHHVFEYLPTVIARSEATWQSPEKILNQVQDDIQNPKVIAIGETGMDKHIYKNTKYSNYLISKDFLDLQKQFFILQIKLAIKYKKILIIHNREAVDETLAVLKNNWSEILAGRSVFHCCEPEEKLLEFAKEYGIFIGVDGDVTYDSAKQNFLKKIPLELLVLETDSPFLVPIPLRHYVVRDESSKAHSGKQSAARIINTPANLKLIVQKIAEILKEDPKIIAEKTFQNSKKLFQH